MVSEHIIKSYDEELRRLDNTITQMGGLAETQLASAIEAVMKRDSRLAADVVEADARVDQLEHDIEGLALGQAMIKDVLDAYVERDADKALLVWARDEELDEMYTSLFRELLTYMIEDPRNITACTHLLFMAKNIERIGDHATNIAETLYFMVHGTPLTMARPKRDRTTSASAPLAGEGPVDGRNGHGPEDDQQ